MPIYKTTKTVAGTPTPVFKLFENTLARSFAIGSDWQQLRFGFRLLLDSTPAAATVTPTNLCFGFDCTSGPLFPGSFDAPSTGVHCIVQRNTYQMQNRVAGPPVVFHSLGGPDQDTVADIHGSTVDYAIGTGETRLSGDPDIAACLLVELTKGAVDYTWDYVFPSVNAMVNRTSANLASAMSAPDMATAAVVLGATYSRITRTIPGATARAALYGQLDRIFVSWAGTLAEPINFADFSLSRIA